MRLSIPVQVILVALQTVALLWSIVLALSFLMGWRPYVVAGGGLVSYPTGSLLFVAPADPLSLPVGAEAAFIAEDSENAEDVEIAACFHIAAVDGAENVYFVFQDHGNGGKVAPSPIPFRQLAGRPVFALPFLGGLALNFGSGLGKIAVPCLVASLLLLFLLPVWVRRRRGRKQKAAKPRSEDG